MKSIPERSADVKLLVAFLSKCKKGDTLRYDELSQKIGREIREHRGLLSSARRIVLRDFSLVFEPVSKVGLRCLDNESLSDVGYHTIGKIRRATHKATTKLETVEYETLSKAAKIKHNVAASMLCALHLMTKPADLKRLEGAVEKRNEQIATAETLKLFLK